MITETRNHLGEAREETDADLEVTNPDAEPRFGVQFGGMNSQAV